MQNLLTELKDLLKEDIRLTVDGKLLKNKIIELGLQLDPTLLKMLLTHENIKRHFFQNVDDVLVFDKVRFQKFVSNKTFLPDSYTEFKNKIGLTLDDEFIVETKDVVLSWPYKDCILEGGQTKEFAKKNEIFWNKTLAPDEIDTLLRPKVLSKWKLIDVNGESEIDGTHEIDLNKASILIRGNNLLALHSISQRYAAKIKLIYIDPPYNTGNDSFNYNDSFNHSTWLVFMKNRLEIARELLKEDGSIWVSLDDTEVHYCKVLMDEIFGRDNFISTIIWNSKYTVSNDAKYVSYQHENILFYAKNKARFEIGLFERSSKQDSAYRNPDNDPRGPWKATPIHAKSGNEDQNYQIDFPNGKSWCPPKGTFPRYSKTRLLELYNDDRLCFRKTGGIDKKTYISEVKQGVTVGSVWSYDDVGHSHSNNDEIADLIGKGAFNNPKGTKLIKKIIQVGNVKDNEIVLDFFLGSGTTAQAVLDYNKDSLKNIRFIGIEQMDYIDTVTCKRIQKTIEKNGCGSYIFAELLELNEEHVARVLRASSKEDIVKAYKEFVDSKFLNYRITGQIDNILGSDFDKLDLDSQRKILIELLDMNQLYINLSEMEDADYSLSNDVISLNKEFYSL